MARVWSIHSVDRLDRSLEILLEDDGRLQPVVVSNRDRIKRIRDVCNDILADDVRAIRGSR
ncbi:MAG: hypothetical protein OXQ94_16275 [Gemmatimonadota bacterium]|nr:hypothetical protein [Gemmatimonadota bacterium]